MANTLFHQLLFFLNFVTWCITLTEYESYTRGVGYSDVNKVEVKDMVILMIMERQWVGDGPGSYSLLMSAVCFSSSFYCLSYTNLSSFCPLLSLYPYKFSFPHGLLIPLKNDTAICIEIFGDSLSLCTRSTLIPD